MKEITPLDNYPGRKAATGQWQKILSEIPKCFTFIEAMCGSAYLSSLVIKSGCSVVINDYNRSVVDSISYDALKDVTKFHLDYRQLIARYDGQPGIVFFFDPPYIFD